MLTITTPATDLSLLTIEEARAAVGVTDNSKDTQLTTLIGYVSSAIARACRVAPGGVYPPTLRLETLTETLRLNVQSCNERRIHQSKLVLARRPVASVTSVVENDETLDSDDYELDASAGMLMRLSSDDIETEWARVKIVIVYDAGWDTVPDDLKMAASKFVATLWTEPGTGSSTGGAKDPNLKRIRIEGVSEREYWVGSSTDPLVPREVMDILTIGGYMNYVLG